MILGANETEFLAAALRGLEAQRRAAEHNIANVETPGFKARDIDFRSVLAGAGDQQLALRTTQRNHLGATSSALAGSELLYRIPIQSSLDGNTVNAQVEQAEFAENAIRYQSTLTFLNGKFRGLKLAIKGQ